VIAFANVLANVLLTLTGIVVPSLLVAVAVRRWIAPVPWRIVIFFLALTLAFLHGVVFSSRLPVPVDEVARGYPFRGVTGEVRAARNPLTNDTVKLFLPWMQVACEELFHGRAPLWNRYSFSGYPLLGNGESAPFSPLFLATIFVPLPKQIVAMAGLKLFLALLFGYLFVKRESPPDAGDTTACVAAAVFAFSIYQTTVLYYSAVSECDWLRPLTARDPRPTSTGSSSRTTTASPFSASGSSSPNRANGPRAPPGGGTSMVGRTVSCTRTSRPGPVSSPRGRRWSRGWRGRRVTGVTVEAPAPAVIASSVPALPGWRVWVGGRRVDPKPGPFLAFPALAGRVDVKVEYRPRVWAISLLGSVVGVGLLAVVIFFTSSPKSWNRTPHPPVVPGP
jgi:hypothetical protein